MEIDISTIRRTIAQGDLRKAFSLVDTNPGLFANSQLNELLVLQSQFHQIEKEKRLNLIEGSTLVNRVIYGFLEVLSGAESDDGQGLAKIESIIALNESKLLFRFNESFLEQFPIVKKQIREALDEDRLPSDFVFQFEKHLKSLGQLKEKIDSLSHASAKEKAYAQDPVLKDKLVDRLNYVERQMSLVEIGSTFKQLTEIEDKINNKSKRNGLIPYLILGGVFLLAAIILLVLFLIIL